MGTCCNRYSVNEDKYSNIQNQVQIKPNFMEEQINNNNNVSAKTQNSYDLIEKNKKHYPKETMGNFIDKIPLNFKEKIKIANENFGIFNYNSIDDSESLILLPYLGYFQFKDYSIYEGQWENGQRKGQGKIYYPNGSIYEGNWKYDCYNGKGRLIHSEGDVYDGDWINNKKNGKGIYYHLNGEKYVGEIYIFY